MRGPQRVPPQTEQTHGERLARIEEQLKTLFRQQDELKASIDKLQRELKDAIADLKADLPCASHAKKLTDLDKKSYAATKVAAALVALGGLILGGIELASALFRGGAKP
jgi:prefoldin subunit 5